ncbi:MAG: MFS transporter [Cytophagaceae bacterium]|nr:MFS transporter [Cytophagaceae bacterium]
MDVERPDSLSQQKSFFRLVLSENRPLRYGTFFYLYAMQGIPAGFALTALSNYLAAQGKTPQAIGSFVALVGLPWALQFVWGPIIDRFQGSGMGRRKPWVIAGQFLAFLASLSLLLVVDPGAELGLLTAAFCVHSIFASVQDASVDAMAISVIPVAERGRINAFMRGGMLFGVGVGAAVLSTVLARYGFRQAAFTLSAILLFFTIITCFIRERREDSLLPNFNREPVPLQTLRWQNQSFRWLFSELMKGLFARSGFLLFGAIITVYFCQSVFIRAYNIYLIQKLGWNDTELSVLTGSYGTALALAVILLGGILADRFGARRLMSWVLLLVGGFLLVFNLSINQWPQFGLAKAGLIAWSTMDPAFSVTAMPVLMAICRKGVEGSQFTSYMALVNLSDIAGSYVAGQLLGITTAPLIGMGCGVLVLGALLVVLLSQRQSTG